jgi:outer membrane protein TolC
LRQPLLQGAGRDFNRAPVVVARLQSDQSLWDFKRDMLSLVRSVEEAYWNLYAAHGALRAVEEVIPLVQEIVRIRESEVEFEIARMDELGEARTRLAEFRQNRIQAMAAVLNQETLLRNLLGLPPSDQRRLVPVDEPLRVPIAIDWNATVSTAVNTRPDIVRQRLAVRVREVQLLVANNGLKPQLDVNGLWRINGLDNELDEAIGLLNDNQFTDWQLGVTLNIPLGYRLASANVRAAQLTLDKDRAQLRQTVHAATHELSDIVREVDSVYQQYLVAEERLRASRQWEEGLRIRAEPQLAAGPLLSAQNLYLQALDAMTRAAVNVSGLVARYSIALARLEEAKGTLLVTNNIHLQEDPCVRARFEQPRR